VDAFSHNLRVAVVEDGCFDRSQVSHAVSLCDLNAKYADVLLASTVLELVDTLRNDLFPNLPTGKPSR
jgi:isochorismate hydrolase